VIDRAVPASTDFRAAKWRLFPAAEFADHLQDWQRVFARTPRPPVLEGPFMQKLLEAFGTGQEVLAIHGEPANPTGIGVFCRVRRGVWETFQPAQAPLSAWMHAAEIPYESLMPSLLEALPGMALAVGISKRDPAIHPRPRDTAQLEALDYIQTAKIAIDRPFADYWKERDKKVRYEIQRRLKRLTEAGLTPRLEVLRDPADVAAAIETYGRLESRGWKGKAGTAVSGDNEQGAFYTALLRDYCARGQARIYRYLFADQTVAMQLCIEGGDTLVFLKTTYDEDFRRYSPGILLKHAIFEHVFNEGRLKQIEFYGAFIEWQSRWTSDSRTLYHVNWFRWAFLAKMRALRHALFRRQSTSRPTADDETDEHADQAAQPGPTYSVTVHRNLSELPDGYEALFRRPGRDSVFLTLPWYRNFIQSGVVAAGRLRLYAVGKGDKQDAVCAVLPMQGRDSGPGPLGATTLGSLSNYYTSLYAPIVDPARPDLQEILDALASSIARENSRWGLVNLHPLSVDTPVYERLIAAFRNAGMLVQTYFCFGNWYLKVGGRSFAQYWESLPSQLRNTIRRKQRLLEASGSSRLVIHKDPADLDAALSAYEQVHAASWKNPEPYPQFIRSLCHAYAELGHLRLGILYVDDHPVAAQIWIVSGRIATIYKLVYDERHARLSPGTVLSAFLMRHVIDVDRVYEVDYLTGDDAYKKDWMSDRRERRGILAFNLRTPYGLYAASMHLAARVVKRVAGMVLRRARS
jgi:CelD/BcsL family acetyltransferase involved in cellulose biosynthesis